MIRLARSPWLWTPSLLLLLDTSLQAQEQRDLVVADFENETYAPWVVEGVAFGKGPAQGALAGQMAVEGFVGKGLVNSFEGGDDATGTLTSPPFVIERSHLNFLIGGGKFSGETCLDLLLEGAVVRTATGPNDRPGGSERLEWASWNVDDLVGKTVVLRVVDRRKGSWGHISVDQIVQSDRSRGLIDTVRELTVERKYLVLPVEEKAPLRRVKVKDGVITREFDIKLAEGKPTFYSALDMASFVNKAIRIEARVPAGSRILETILPMNSLPNHMMLYNEPWRPRVHFTSRRGWLNDPNGLVFFEGEYHLFYQHNPYGWDWGNMHWGHAVSPDLMRWSEQPIAIYPRAYGDWAFSGSAVVDSMNTSGFSDGSAPALVAAYTSTGRGECIVFSTDRGRTWTEFDGNPVVKHDGRDPRLFWHEPTKAWAMAVYDETGGARDVAFYTSPNLKKWTFASRIGGFYECPDLFQLPVQGKPDQKLWVLSAADGAYLLGQFDGKIFKPDALEKHKVWHGNFYAAQTFNDEPKGRRVQIGWAQGINFPGEPFNQQMNIPCELTLRPTDEGVRLFAEPVAEVRTTWVSSVTRVANKATGEGLINASIQTGEAFDLTMDAAIGTSGKLDLAFPGASLAYDVARKTLACNGVTVPLDPKEGRIQLRILVDKGSVEVFGNHGQVAICRGLTSKSDRTGTVKVTLDGTGDRAINIEVHPFVSTWR